MLSCPALGFSVSAFQRFSVCLLALLTIDCQAAIPENDSFATRISLFGTNVSTTGNNVGATKELDEPDPNFTGGKSVWWSWTAPSAAYVTITTAGSSFDTTLAVYTGSILTNLTLVTFNDTDLGTSVVNFNASAGTAYQIQVDGCDNELYETNKTEGNISLQLTVAPPVTPPVNDNFANRITISGNHINNVPGSNVGATAEAGEPFHADTLGFKSVWWTWTAPSSGGLTLTTQGSAIDTVLAVYTGNSVANLTLVTANDEDPVFGYESFATCNVTSNVTYQIAVDGFEGAVGDIRFDLDLDAAFPVPANNNFANRTTLTGTNINITASNVGATYEPGEPMHLYIFGGKTVWWTWTAPSSGAVTLTASNNMLDTLVCVYRGTSLGSLIFVAGNDEDYFLSPSLDGDSTAFFNAIAGVTYQFVVDGVDGTSGSFKLRLTMDLADPVPANDNFASRIALSGTNVSTTGSNLGATVETGEPLHRGYYGGSSVWWRWTSPGPGFVNIDTTNTLTDVPDTLLAIYTGSTLTTLAEVASDNNSGGRNWASRVTFPTRSNVTYQIAIDGVDGDSWDNLSLHIRYTPAAYTLTTATNPSIGGTVDVTPLPDQGGKYAPGSLVTLTATPSAGSVFTGWSGDADATNNPLVVAMTSNKTITAEFFVTPTTKVWNGSHPQNGNWSVGGNWVDGVAPVPGDNLIFPPGAARLASNTNNLTTNTTLNFLTFGGADYVLRGNPLRLTNGIICTNASGTNVLALNVLLGANQSLRSSNAASIFELAGNLNLSNRTLTVEATGAIALSGIISGTGGIVKTNPGTLSLSGANTNTYSGSTVVNQGTLVLAKTGVAVPGVLTIGDGVGGANADVVRFMANSQLATSSAVTLNSSGQLDLNGFSGTIGSLTLTGGNVDTGAGTLGLNGNLTGNASSTQANITGNLSLQGATRTFTVADGTAPVDLLISATITNGAAVAGITKAGSGKLQLSAANSYNGLTTVSQGSLAITHNSALGASSQGTIVNSSASLLLGGLTVSGEPLTLTAATLQADTGSNAWTGTISVTNTCFLSTATNVTLRLSGILSGPGAITKTGDGTVSFAGNSPNTYAGLTTVQQGTLILSNSAGIAVPGALTIGDGSGGSDADVVRLDATAQFPTTAQVTINSSGLLNLNGSSYSLASLSGSGHVDFGGASAVLTIGANNASSSFGGLISGAGQVIKAGNGTLTLAGNNTYSGQTTVNGGQLIINGQQSSSPVVVNSPGLLGGSGRVGNVSGSGTVSPGTSPGMLSCGNVTFSSNTTFQVELNGTTAGSSYDQLNVSGTVTLGGNLNATLGFTPAISNSFTIIDNNANDAVVGTFNGLPEGSYVAIGGVFLQISYSAGAGSNNVTLTRISVTQPAISSVAIDNNTAVIMGTGQAGVAYVLETTPGLEPPVTWTTVATNSAAVDGSFQFTHTDALDLPTRFYRVRMQ